MKVSIIIPAYNAERTIKRCLDSILLQSYTDFEALVVNNNSTDKTSEILKQYSLKDSRIISLFEQNKGVGYARNNALDHAKGDLVTFIDSDDYVDANFLDVLVNQLKGKSSISVCGVIEEDQFSKILIQSNYIPISIKNDDKYISLINHHKNKGIAGYLCNKMFYRETIGELRFDPQITMCEDILFLLELMCNIDIISISSDNCYHYVRYEDSACGKSYADEKYYSKYSAHYKLFELICKYTKNKSVIRLYANQLVYTCVELSSIIAKRNSMSSFLRLTKEMRKSISRIKKYTEVKSYIIELYIFLLDYLPISFWLRFQIN